MTVTLRRVPCHRAASSPIAGPRECGALKISQFVQVSEHHYAFTKDDKRAMVLTIMNEWFPAAARNYGDKISSIGIFIGISVCVEENLAIYQ